MTTKKIPLETLILLHSKLNELPKRSPQRKSLVKETAALFSVSVPTVYRNLRQYHEPKLAQRQDYNRPRIMPQSELKQYCEIIAALRLRTCNKKGRHLSTKECIHLLEEHGVETNDGLVKAPPNLLKYSTVYRYLKRWGYSMSAMSVEPLPVAFQARYSNDCWQFDFSPSELKKIRSATPGKSTDKKLMLASVVDDRSGVYYQEYYECYGEDAMTALRFLFNAMSPKKDKSFPFQGIPKLIYLDNGPVAKSNAFHRVMNYLNIEIRTHMPKGSDGRRTTARAKGKVERSFRTVKESLETLYHFHEPSSVEEANEWLQQYLKRYNNMPHRSEPHSHLDDWTKNLPTEGFKEMCKWERFCSFAREPEQRKADPHGCVSVDGVRYQLDHDMAGQSVTLLWGMFDNELYVEKENTKTGPYYPVDGPVVLGNFRKHKKSTVEKRADYIGKLAEKIRIPRSALTGEKQSVKNLLNESGVVQHRAIQSIPFEDNETVEQRCFKNKVSAKIAISEYLGQPLARLSAAQINEVNEILDETLDKKIVINRVKKYFALNTINCLGEESCTEK